MGRCWGRRCGRRGIFENDHVADSTGTIYLLYLCVVDGDLTSPLALACGERGSGHDGEITVGNAIEGGVGGKNLRCEVLHRGLHDLSRCGRRGGGCEEREEWGLFICLIDSATPERLTTLESERDAAHGALFVVWSALHGTQPLPGHLAPVRSCQEVFTYILPMRTLRHPRDNPRIHTYPPIARGIPQLPSVTGVAP